MPTNALNQIDWSKIRVIQRAEPKPVSDQAEQMPIEKALPEREQDEPSGYWTNPEDQPAAKDNRFRRSQFVKDLSYVAGRTARAARAAPAVAARTAGWIGEHIPLPAPLAQIRAAAPLVAEGAEQLMPYIQRGAGRVAANVASGAEGVKNYFLAPPREYTTEDTPRAAIQRIWEEPNGTRYRYLGDNPNPKSDKNPANWRRIE